MAVALGQRLVVVPHVVVVAVVVAESIVVVGSMVAVAVVAVLCTVHRWNGSLWTAAAACRRHRRHLRWGNPWSAAH